MKSAYKSDKYSSKEDADEIESLTERLTADLRKHIRQVSYYPILSQEWLEMAETFGRIANISDMESKLAAGKEDKTLWETEEQALRFILEDGKLNLCLRNLIEYKRQQRASRGIDPRSSPFTEHIVQCDKFEKGVGTVLRNAWNHVEAIQTTDLFSLTNHISDVIDSALHHPDIIANYCQNGDIHQRQEIMIFYYLFCMLKNVEEIREDR